ncbi:unnamed protein product [Microthlaspi erraticum]|uniref:Uncharacterized protein n=1 Tax=Microthlaspi erraticum TaxID=1685480 RepID=A0A6D2JIK1_9BRAS|nr:unnamed protein product [Microthlaspi erraticum]
MMVTRYGRYDRGRIVPRSYNSRWRTVNHGTMVPGSDRTLGHMGNVVKIGRPREDASRVDPYARPNVGMGGVSRMGLDRGTMLPGLAKPLGQSLSGCLLNASRLGQNTRTRPRATQWVEFLADYDLEIIYHSGKANQEPLRLETVDQTDFLGRIKVAQERDKSLIDAS